MYTRPRYSSHQPIPSISTFSSYPSPSHILHKSEDLTWYTPPETFARPDPIHHHPLPPFPPPPPITPAITKSNNPHLPAEKNAALKAAKIAKECHDLGPHTTQRFKCPFPACNKFFQRRYNFKVHVRKHTKETPYTCNHPGCGKKFRWRSSISHHLKAHDKRNNALRVTQTPNTPLPLPSTSVSYNSAECVPLKLEDTPRRAMLTRHLPTSPISSGTPTHDKFQGFGLEHVALAPPAEVAMDELNFHGEHVTGMMFDNIM